ncbi:helix-hairpin-helix domain-containing protein [Streptomyces sp. NPDC086835]|uniref:helix-hairpin-helix domain-containing protein n=1 Tax=Streptomyces sp. NPDC086835 TaxID=3365761 RepID=UPI003830E538
MTAPSRGTPPGSPAAGPPADTAEEAVAPGPGGSPPTEGAGAAEAAETAGDTAAAGAAGAGGEAANSGDGLEDGAASSAGAGADTADNGPGVADADASAATDHTPAGGRAGMVGADEAGADSQDDGSVAGASRDDATAGGEEDAGSRDEDANEARAGDGDGPKDDASLPGASRDGGPTADGEEAAGAGAGADGAGDGGVSEAEAEIAAQRELRARIEQRKAEKEGPIDSGAKLSGKAADLLAAVRAVESGEKAATAYFDSPPPEPRRAAPAAAPPVRPRAAEPAPAAVPAEALAGARAVLLKGGAPESLAPQVAELLGESAGEALAEDPWRLLSVPGVRPEQADGFARALLGAEATPGDERRTSALVTWVLERAALQGHTALEASALRAALAERSVPDPEEAVQQAVADGTVLVFQEGVEEDAPVTVLLGLDRYAMAEESLADGLARLVRTGPSEVWEGTELMRAAGANGLVVHTGGEAARAEPVALAEQARAMGLRAAVAVHGENGVRRLGPAAGAVTVADLLSGAAGPGRDEDGAFALDLLVVLDAPQLDVETAAMLVESMPDGSRLVLGGDPGVLGGAGAGRVFADVLAARVCPQVASRTPDPGPLGELVSGISVGELNQVEAPGKEVVIVPVRDAGEAVHRTVQLVADSVPRAIGVPAEQTQVITVGHGGSAGTRALNAALKQRLNPGAGRFAGFDPGDRVAYAQALGRTVTGTVVSAGPDGLHLDCEGTRTVVPRERVDSALRHGWALTAHQAAGMRWPAVVVVLPGDAAQSLSRPWVHTAFGRAERHLSVVHGVDQALPRAVAERPGAERTTRLRTLLEGLLAEPAAQPPAPGGAE